MIALFQYSDVIAVNPPQAYFDFDADIGLLTGKQCCG